MAEATKVFTKATTDNSIAAEQQAEFNAKLKEKAEENGDVPKENSLALTDSDTQVNNMTIEEGMERTGGFVGTDKDPNDPIQLQLSELSRSDKMLGKASQRKLASKKMKKVKERLKALKKKRRKLREKLLCSTNCQFSSWSFTQGIILSHSCPSDCSIRTDLQGEFIGKDSTKAMDAYIEHPDVISLEDNQKQLGELDKKIDSIEAKLISSLWQKKMDLSSLSK